MDRGVARRVSPDLASLNWQERVGPLGRLLQFRSGILSGLVTEAAEAWHYSFQFYGYS